MTNMQPPTGSTWPAPPPAPKPPRFGLWARVGMIFGGIVVLGASIGLTSGSDPAPVAQSSAPTISAAPRATYTAPTYSPPTYQAPAAPAVPDGAFTNGIYEVGDEVAPGEYKSPGPQPGLFSTCYIHVKSGEKYLDQKVSNDGQVRIKILDSWIGAELDVRGCQPFAPAG